MSTDLTTAHWFKSSRSGTGKDCVEIAHLAEGLVGVRDSKNTTGPALILTPSQWDEFTTTLRTETPASS